MVVHFIAKKGVSTMNQELREYYKETLTIRKQTLANLQAARERYIANGGTDSFLIELHDSEIAFATKSIQDMKKLLDVE